MSSFDTGWYGGIPTWQIPFRFNNSKLVNTVVPPLPNSSGAATAGAAGGSSPPPLAVVDIPAIFLNL